MVYQQLRSMSTHPSASKLDGWVYHTAKQWQENFGLGRKALANAIDHLKRLGLIRTQVKCLRERNVPMTFYFLEEVTEDMLHRDKSKCTKGTNANAPKVHTNIVQQENIVQQNIVQQQSSEPTAIQEDLPVKNKSVLSLVEVDVSEIMKRKKTPKTVNDLYQHYRKLYVKHFPSVPPENMTKESSSFLSGIRKEFGEDTPRFLEIVLRDWLSASAYVANHTSGLSPVKSPNLGYIRKGTNLMHFRAWFDEWTTPKSFELKINPAVKPVAPAPVAETPVTPTTDPLLEEANDFFKTLGGKDHA